LNVITGRLAAVAGVEYGDAAMKKAENDGRMFWMRMLEAAKNDKSAPVLESEFSSEVKIPGLLDYADGALVSSFLTLAPDPSGMHKYALRVRTPASSPEMSWADGAPKGYEFRKGPIGELIALFSLAFEARLYHVATSSASLGSGIRLKTEFWPIRGLAGPNIDPVVFCDTDRNFTNSLPPLLDELLQIPARYHQRIITAADHYGRALRYIGIEDEMVYVRLVSAIETVAYDHRISGDLFDGIRAEQVLKLDMLSEAQQEELVRTFETRKAKARFVGFLVRHSGGFFDGEAREPVHTQVTPETLPAIATAIYNARSGYLHSGEPMYISRGIPMFAGWHMDASVGVRSGDRKYVAKQKLPYLVFAHRLVRHCLLAYIRNLVPSAAIAS